MNIQNLNAKHVSQRGMSMVELMISLALGLFLIAGIVHLFVGSKSTNATLHAVSKIQENGRIAIERLKINLRTAGYMGCSNLAATAPNAVVPNASFPFDLASVVQGVNNATAGNADNAVANTDVLTVITASAADANLQPNMAAKNSDITITANQNNFQAGDTLVISDCENADIFVASAVTNNPANTVIQHKSAGSLNISDELSKAYRDNAIILRTRQITYAVQDTGRTDKSGNAILSLFETQGGAAVEIITGVDDMQLTYGVDTGVDGTADLYDTANNIAGTQWGNVVSVRIALLISTAGDKGRDTHPYTFQGVAVAAPPDNRIRREFTTTVSLRNRNS